MLTFLNQRGLDHSVNSGSSGEYENDIISKQDRNDQQHDTISVRGGRRDASAIMRQRQQINDDGNFSVQNKNSPRGVPNNDNDAAISEFSDGRKSERDNDKDSSK